MAFEDFCKNTTLHGWRFVTKTKNPVGKLIWLTFAIGSVGVAGIFIYAAVSDFVSSTGENIFLY